MLASTKNQFVKQAGTTVAELVVAISIIGILIVPATLAMLYFYGGTLQNNLQSRLAVESENVLRALVDELRISSGIRAANTIPDPYAPPGGWTTSQASLVLIISTPVIDVSNNFVTDSATGKPYQNELVYFATNNTLYKRYLANPNAPGNRFKTSCPAASASAACPVDVTLSKHFKTMDFVFYDQDDIVTTNHTIARSIKMTLQMEDATFGRPVSFSNNIRITLRNSL